MTFTTRLCCAVLCLGLVSACGSNRDKTTTPSQAAPSTYGGQLAGQDLYTDRAIKEGIVDTWIASPVYLDDTAMLAVYRGPKPSDSTTQQLQTRSSLSSSDFSKIAWNKGHTYNDALLNMVRVKDTGNELLFPKTPYAFAELVFLVPARTPISEPNVAAIASSERVEVKAGGDADHTIHVMLHQAQPAATPATPMVGPQQVTAPNAPHHVARHFNTWELPRLQDDIALGCAVLRTESTNVDGEKVWHYRGEIWVRNLKDGRVFKHGDEKLEPKQWQLHPGARPQLEVTMADEQGWPSRVDFIDLNTFEVRSMPSREQLKEMGVE